MCHLFVCLSHEARPLSSMGWRGNSIQCRHRQRVVSLSETHSLLHCCGWERTESGRSCNSSSMTGSQPVWPWLVPWSNELQWKSESVSCSIRSNSLSPHGLYGIQSRLLCPWDFPGKDTGVGCHFLLQGIFPFQRSNPGLPYWRQILYRLSHQGSP